MDDAGYIFAAFAVVWVILFGYLFLIGRIQRRLEEEMKCLEREISRPEVDK